MTRHVLFILPGPGASLDTLPTMTAIVKNWLFYLILLCFFCNVFTGTREILFDLEALAITSFKFLGDAHVFNNTIRLTGDFLVPNTRAGGFFFDKPVRFRQSVNSIPSSFATNFSFSISNLNPDSVGGCMAFVISRNDDAVGDAGGHLGIPTAAVALEFDTRMDVEFEDVNWNHVGLDLGSMVSSDVVDLDSVNVNLRSGKQVNTWIDYSGQTRKLNVYISHSNIRPKFAGLSTTLDLIEYVDEFMFVGFTASTHGSTEVHSVQCWSFRSSFDDPDSDSQPRKRQHRMLPIIAAFGGCGVVLVLAVVGGVYVNCIRHCYNKYRLECNASIICCICGWKKNKDRSRGNSPDNC